jgi:SRSO17 transposase
VPEEVGFRSKPEIAREMVTRALDAGVLCDTRGSGRGPPASALVLD